MTGRRFGAEPASKASSDLSVACAARALLSVLHWAVGKNHRAVQDTERSSELLPAGGWGRVHGLKPSSSLSISGYVCTVLSLTE